MFKVYTHVLRVTKLSVNEFSIQDGIPRGNYENEK